MYLYIRSIYSTCFTPLRDHQCGLGELGQDYNNGGWQLEELFRPSFLCKEILGFKSDLDRPCTPNLTQLGFKPMILGS